jgi:hypothetical protein
MCMGKAYAPLTQKRVIVRMAGKKGYIRVYKVVRQEYQKRYVSACRGETLPIGIHTAHSLEEYFGGWHAFRDIKSAEGWSGDGYLILECLALPDWVKDVGKSLYVGCYRTILLRTLCFPRYPSRKVTVAEFRQQLRKFRTDKS